MSDIGRSELAIAELQAAEARQRLSETVAQLQARLDPKALAEDAKQAGLLAAKAGLDGARRNPGIMAGAVAAAGLLLARHRIFELVGRKKKDPPSPPEGM